MLGKLQLRRVKVLEDLRELAHVDELAPEALRHHRRGEPKHELDPYRRVDEEHLPHVLAVPTRGDIRDRERSNTTDRVVWRSIKTAHDMSMYATRSGRQASTQSRARMIRREMIGRKARS